MRNLVKYCILVLQVLLGRFVRLLLGPHVTAMVVETEEGLFAVDPEDHGVGGRLRRRGRYGEAELERLRPLLGPDSSVLVVGAHVGTLAIPLAKICRKMTAIEANPKTFRLLRMNMAINGVENCTLHRIAVSDREERISFQLARNNSGNSRRLPLVSGFEERYDNPDTIVVDAVRLDGFLPEHAYTLILMDIEGSEYFALRGMPEILKHSGALAVEFSPQALRRVAGVRAEEFVALVEPFFDALHVPSRGLVVRRERFLEILGDMFNRDEADAGIIFMKSADYTFRQD